MEICLTPTYPERVAGGQHSPKSDSSDRRYRWLEHLAIGFNWSLNNFSPSSDRIGWRSSGSADPLSNFLFCCGLCRFVRLVRAAFSMILQVPMAYRWMFASSAAGTTPDRTRILLSASPSRYKFFPLHFRRISFDGLNIRIHHPLGRTFFSGFRAGSRRCG